MKALRFLNHRIPVKTLLLGIGLLGLTAWSPPSSTLVTVGTSNTISGGNAFIAGQNNTHEGLNNLMVGKLNEIKHAVAGSSVYNSAAIGYKSKVAATRGWAMGWESRVTADKGVAIGSGAKANVEMGTALGRFNTNMLTKDVLVVGNGLTNTVRSTALRVTEDSVILGNSGTPVLLASPQGDISMGSYSN